MGIFHKKQTLPPDQKLLFDEINKAKTQIELAQINFQSALDPRSYRLLYFSRKCRLETLLLSAATGSSAIIKKSPKIKKCLSDTDISIWEIF